MNLPPVHEVSKLKTIIKGNFYEFEVEQFNMGRSGALFKWPTVHIPT